jgi:TPR repeat protein
LLLAGPAAAGVGGERASDPAGGKSAAFRDWLPRAVQGDPQAQYELGRFFAEGPARREDFAEAARWFRRAAEQNHARAQSELARLYTKGLGVSQDYVRAYIWFDRAADGFGYGLRREQAIELRDMTGAFLTPEQRAAAERVTEAWRARAGFRFAP